MSTVKVFLSSTFSDLRDERLEVIEVFRRMRTVDGLDVDLITMEDFGFSHGPPLEKCLELLERADAYLGLLGHRYGSIPRRGTRSYTDREYRAAEQLGLPIFILEKTGPVNSADIERDPGKLTLLNKLREHAHAHHLVLGFNGCGELGKALAQYLPRALEEHFPQRLRPAGDPGLLVPCFRLQDRRTPFTHERTAPVTLDVLGISSIGLLRERSVIEDYLRRECRIRILVVRRGSDAYRLLVANKGTDHLEDDLEQAVERARRLHEFAKVHGGALELREIDWIPSVTLFLFDVGLPTALGWVGAYTPDISAAAGSKWMIQLSADRGGEALSFYGGQFDQLWSRALPT